MGRILWGPSHPPGYRTINSSNTSRVQNAIDAATERRINRQIMPVDPNRSIGGTAPRSEKYFHSTGRGMPVIDESEDLADRTMTFDLAYCERQMQIRRLPTSKERQAARFSDFLDQIFSQQPEMIHASPDELMKLFRSTQGTRYMPKLPEPNKPDLSHADKLKRRIQKYRNNHPELRDLSEFQIQAIYTADIFGSSPRTIRTGHINALVNPKSLSKEEKLAQAFAEAPKCLNIDLVIETDQGEKQKDAVYRKLLMETEIYDQEWPEDLG